MDGQLIFSKKTLHLNAEQMTAVKRNPFVHQRILATAGSGKTTTLTAKIAYLIEQFGVHPESIVLLTFSRNAATEEYSTGVGSGLFSANQKCNISIISLLQSSKNSFSSA